MRHKDRKKRTSCKVHFLRDFGITSHRSIHAIILESIEKNSCFFFDTPEFLHSSTALTQRKFFRQDGQDLQERQEVLDRIDKINGIGGEGKLKT
jgi:hypothetical protein